MIQKQLEYEKDMLQGNIARICVSDDIDEIENMRIWAHRRIDAIASIRKQMFFKDGANG